MVNKVFLTGYIGHDPVLRYTSGGTAVTTIQLATNHSYYNKNNEKVKETEWHNVILYGRMAENVCQYKRKGSILHIEGRIKTRKWTDKNGNNHKSKDIIAKEMDFLIIDSNPDTNDAPHEKHNFINDNDDIPF